MKKIADSWYVVNGTYIADADLAARVRKQDEERQARDAARRAEWIARHAEVAA